MRTPATTFRFGKAYRGNGGPVVRHQGQPLTLRNADIFLLGRRNLPASSEFAQFLFSRIVDARKGNEQAIAFLKERLLPNIDLQCFRPFSDSLIALFKVLIVAMLFNILFKSFNITVFKSE